jgi:hypothetical protein
MVILARKSATRSTSCPPCPPTASPVRAPSVMSGTTYSLRAPQSEESVHAAAALSVCDAGGTDLLRIIALTAMSCNDAHSNHWFWKYHYLVGRPVTQYRQVPLDQPDGLGEQRDKGWGGADDMALLTNQNPEHPSGHASRTNALTASYRMAFGDEVTFRTISFSQPFAPARAFDSFTAFEVQQLGTALGASFVPPPPPPPLLPLLLLLRLSYVCSTIAREPHSRVALWLERLGGSDDLSDVRRSALARVGDRWAGNGEAGDVLHLGQSPATARERVMAIGPQGTRTTVSDAA